MFECSEFHLVDDRTPFFAPTVTGVLEKIVDEFNADAEQIKSLAQSMSTSSSGILAHFFNANMEDSRLTWQHQIAKLFEQDGALQSLASTYWERALKLTNVHDFMPQKRRDEWRSSLDAWKSRSAEAQDMLPPFTLENVRATISNLMSLRPKFFSERVDGIFQKLSPDHVTNCPEGFGRRMIIAGAFDSFGYVNDRSSGYINDLRCVVAKFMGRDEPHYSQTNHAMRSALMHAGTWLSLDGDAIRIRVYKVGTAHIEIHPDMAWRLNQVLAAMHPTAIPTKFRTKPKAANKKFTVLQRPLPFAVLHMLSSRRLSADKLTLYLTNNNEIVYKEALQALQSIGGVPCPDKRSTIQFTYDPSKVIDDICLSGCIPDAASHQFYPTPERLAEDLVDLADISDSHTCLEPSAGTGNIARLLPTARTTCIEISDIHCSVLQAIGLKAIKEDFLAWDSKGLRFDRICMNPPFSEGRWKLHLEAASQLLSSDGKLVAILPASAKGANVLPGWQLDWSHVYQNEFAGTGVSVVILVAHR